MPQATGCDRFHFVCTAVAWMVLGSTIFARTYISDSSLKAKVEQIWARRRRRAPSARLHGDPCLYRESTVNGAKVTKAVKHYETRTAPLMGSDAAGTAGPEHRQKGLLWYAAYGPVPGQLSVSATTPPRRKR